MSVNAMRLKYAVAVVGTDIEVLAYCDCGRFLGHYWAGPPVSAGPPISVEPGLTLSEKALGRIVRAPTREEIGRSEGYSVRGPRTQPGLYPETYGERTYIRKRCPCRPVHKKRGFASIGELPVTVRSANVVTLVWD